MANAYQKYLKTKSKEISLDKKKEVFALLLSRSMMSSEDAIKNCDLKVLTNKDAKEVLSFYSDEPKSIDIIKK